MVVATRKTLEVIGQSVAILRATSVSDACATYVLSLPAPLGPDEMGKMGVMGSLAGWATYTKVMAAGCVLLPSQSGDPCSRVSYAVGQGAR